jgi:hypothetical protein
MEQLGLHPPALGSRIEVDVSRPPLPLEEVCVRERESTDITPNSEEIRRLLERRRAAELGYELPLYASEAAEYIGVSLSALGRLVSGREIPTHVRPCPRGEMLLFYVAELEEWLVTSANKGAANPSPSESWATK